MNNHCDNCDYLFERKDKERYCEECGSELSKIVKSKIKYCEECGQPYIRYDRECPKKNCFLAGLLFWMWGYHDSAFMKNEKIIRLHEIKYT